MPNCFHCRHLDYDLALDEDDEDNELVCMVYERDPSKLKNNLYEYGVVNHELVNTDCPCDEFEEAPIVW